MAIHQREASQLATSPSTSLGQQGSSVQGQVLGWGQGSKWTNFLSPEDSSSGEEGEDFSLSAFSEVLRSYGRSQQEVEIDILRAHQQQLLTPHGHLIQRDQGDEVGLFTNF